ncbi:hypothetical protein GO755_24630 [Spirosoma sp. HMF4905]|uniref:Helix-turn-helix domain-containing protein n=1 Tax=Spirosoma arboris TaxID=2682092 RepID=A0A7K1SHG5_9BACT|nr:hypothetical protein [Spirosoma arboris]MVM33249.1 hypothetical protein [Spirosoma arboris]
MVGTPQVVIHVTPEQFEKIIEDRLENAFQKHLSAKITKEQDPLELATIKKVCSFLHITRQTLHKMSKDTPEGAAMLVPRKVGRRLLYKWEEVLAVAKEYRRFKAA